MKPMEDRGSFTQNHCDHIHISFVAAGSVQFDPAAVTPWGETPTPEAAVAADAGAAGATSDATRPSGSAAADAGAGALPASSADLGVPPIAPPSGRAASPSFLVGDCALTRAPARGASAALWLALLLVARGAARRPRRASRG